ncbi:MAG: glycosyltransferase [Candidatus Bathyarchaeia archaeon]
MPLKNSAWCIKDTLDSLESQTYPKRRIQLIFVDGYSTDETYSKILAWADEHRHEYYEITVLREKSNIPQARNICLRNSKGNYILFWDSDVKAPHEGINTLLTHLKDPTTGMAGLPYDIDKPSLFDRVYRAREPPHTSPVEGLTMGFTMIRRETVEKTGLFNEKMTGYEDREYCLRVKKNGYKLIFDPTVRCIHLKPETFLSGRYLERKGIFDYKRFLWYNLTKAPTNIIEIAKRNPKTHAAKTAYYLLYPLVLVAAILSLFTSNLITTALCLLYVGLPAAFHLRKTRRVSYGLAAAAIFTTGGIALAYGMTSLALKRTLTQIYAKLKKAQHNPTVT